VKVSVDTTGASTAFDPAFWINDGASCTLLFADDNFTCTFRPTSYSCPSGTVTAAADGVYEIVVISYGECTGTDAEYALSVDAGTDPGLTLLLDDAPAFETREVTVTVIGEATIAH
jgi:hypothetical protein